MGLYDVVDPFTPLLWPLLQYEVPPDTVDVGVPWKYVVSELFVPLTPMGAMPMPQSCGGR